MATKKGIKTTNRFLRKQPPKKRKVFPAWLTVFVIGFSSGLLVQFIPQISATTTKLASCLEEHPLRLNWSSPSDQSYPYSHPVLVRDGYTLNYDGRIKTAAWVQEELTIDSISGDTDRTQFHFCQDPDIPSHIQADLPDYVGSRFDRGHLAPAGDHKANPEAMRETFYLSNICPQVIQFNRGYWRSLEKHVRDLTQQYGKVRVVTGPLFLPNVEEDGKKYIKYQVIGTNNVAVPTHFFKIITIESLNESWAYILPNQKIDSRTPLDEFLTTIEKVEKASGIIFNR